MAGSGEARIDKEINIIILGASGAGKSTIGNRITKTEKFNINGVCREKAASRIVTVTKKIRSLTCRLTVVEVNFSMYVKDLYLYTQSVFKDSEIHLVLFVLRKGRLSHHDIQFEIEIIKQFDINLLKPICALIITHCEFEKSHDDVILQFKRENESVSNLFKKGIFCTGFPVLDEYRQENPSIIESIKANMKEDQDTLDRLIESLIIKDDDDHHHHHDHHDDHHHDHHHHLHNNLIKKTNSFIFWLGFNGNLQFKPEEEPDESS